MKRLTTIISVEDLLTHQRLTLHFPYVSLHDSLDKGEPCPQSGLPHSYHLLYAVVLYDERV